MAMLGCWTRSWRSDGSKTTSSCLEEIQTELHYFQVEPSFTPSYILFKQDAMSIDAVAVETDKLSRLISTKTELLKTCLAMSTLWVWY